MKLKILVIIETVALISLVLFSYIKSAEADKQQVIAMQLANDAINLSSTLKFLTA